PTGSGKTHLAHAIGNAVADAHPDLAVACISAMSFVEEYVAAMQEGAAAFGGEVFAPTPRLATDNAAMIGAAALFHRERGVRHDASLNAHASRPIPGLVDATAPRR
ncbi:MAG: DnaA ATPase domain-containing protein, partial [Gemmatimonadota bacterium]